MSNIVIDRDLCKGCELCVHACPQKILGISTHALDEALRAEAAGADYLGFGALYPTESKEVQHLPGPAGLAAVRLQVRLPIVAIGGINRDNARDVIDGGVHGIACISAIIAAAEPREAARELISLLPESDPADD